MNNEKTTDSEETMNIEEPIEDEETPLETEPEPKQQDRRPLWMIGGLVVVALALFACCVLAGGAFLTGRGTDTGTPVEPAPTRVEPAPAKQAPVAVINVPSEATVGDEIEFHGSGSQPGSSPIAHYEWDFGDGTSGKGAVVTHVYHVPENYRVTLTVTGEDGLSNTSKTVKITIKEIVPQLPTIQSFSVSPAQLEPGECAGVSWSVSAEGTLVQVRRNGRVVIDKGGAVGQQMDCLDKAGSYTYRLEAYNSAGESVFQEATVTVTEAPPENPLANTNWQLSAMNVNQVPVPGSTITARFDAASGLSGNGGCNSYEGVYTVRGASLGIIGLSVLGMTCGDDLDQQEQLYLRVLQSAASFEISRNQLIIKDASGREVLRFNRIG
jgi:heat shock protein HslJ